MHTEEEKRIERLTFYMAIEFAVGFGLIYVGAHIPHEYPFGIYIGIFLIASGGAFLISALTLNRG